MNMHIYIIYTYHVCPVVKKFIPDYSVRARYLLGGGLMSKQHLIDCKGIKVVTYSTILEKGNHWLPM